MKNVCAAPMALACTTIAGSRPSLVANRCAAPSAFGPVATGRVKDSWTMPSPVVSPYADTKRSSDMSGLQQITRGVPVRIGSWHTPSSPRPLSGGRRVTPNAPSPMARSRPSASMRSQQVDRLGQDLTGTRGDEAVGAAGGKSSARPAAVLRT